MNLAWKIFVCKRRSGEETLIKALFPGNSSSFTLWNCNFATACKRTKITDDICSHVFFFAIVYIVSYCVAICWWDCFITVETFLHIFKLTHKIYVYINENLDLNYVVRTPKITIKRSFCDCVPDHLRFEILNNSLQTNSKGFMPLSSSKEASIIYSKRVLQKSRITIWIVEREENLLAEMWRKCLKRESTWLSEKNTF